MSSTASVRAYIGIGSNLETPVHQVEQAIVVLSHLPQSRLLATSSLYCSVPLGPSEQPDYINAAAVIDTQLTPLELLNALQQIEVNQGRVRESERWGPRTLDLDLLLYADTVIDMPRLQVPHPQMHLRNFVLVPLLEIAPQLCLPDGTALQVLQQALGHEGLVRYHG